MPPSPEERPAALDQEWSARAKDGSPPVEAGSTPVDSSVYYSGCHEVHAAGKAPLSSSDPGYRIEMDGDGDGVACEPHRAR